MARPDKANRLAVPTQQKSIGVVISLLRYTILCRALLSDSTAPNAAFKGSLWACV